MSNEEGLYGQPIYQFIRARLDPVGRLAESVQLPDDEKVVTGTMRWMAGALDGVVTHHGRGGTAQEHAQRVADLICAAAADPGGPPGAPVPLGPPGPDSTRSSRSRRGSALRRTAPSPVWSELYAALVEGDVLEFLDPAIELLVDIRPSRDAVHRIGRWLATTAADRAPVKVGMALLGVTGLGEDVDVVRVLGAHDEFTLYAAVAVTNGLPEPEVDLWKLAAGVDGWGRIHCVEQLRDTQDPQIREWILREGFRNAVMYEYLAHLAATTGGLLEALRRPVVDRDLLTAAGEILAALCAGGPGPELSHYADGVPAVFLYLDLVAHQGDQLVDLVSVDAVRQRLLLTEELEDLAAQGWTPEARERVLTSCAVILGDPRWPPRIRAGLQATDQGEFRRATAAGRAYGLDTFDAQVARILVDPLDSMWFEAWRLADHDRAEQLCALARTLLPLAEIGTGAADELGLGPQWRAHSALEWTLQALRDHPGVGADLLLLALDSPVVRNRNMALQALKEWPKDSWPVGAREVVAKVSSADPAERTRQFAAEILAEATA